MSLVPASRLSVRVAQIVASVAALVLAPMSYASSGFQLDAKSTAAIYFTNYAALLCALYYVVALRVLKLSGSPPSVRNQRLSDCVLVVVLVLGATLEMKHDVIPHCEIREAYFEKRASPVFRCGMKTASVVATYVNAALFLASAAWSFVRDSAETSFPSSAVEDISNENTYASVATPVKPTSNGAASSTVATLAVHRPSFHLTRRCSRAVQLLSSVVAIVVLLVGYKLYESGLVTSMPMFSVMAGYTSALYSLWHVVAVETAKLTTRPTVRVERVVDGVLAVVVLLAAALLSTSSSVKDCSSTGSCGHLMAGFVLLFVSVAAHAGSFGLSFAEIEDELMPCASTNTYVDEPIEASNTVNMV